MEYCLEKASRDIIHFVFRVHHCFSTDFPLQNVIFILIIILYNLYFFCFTVIIFITFRRPLMNRLMKFMIFVVTLIIAVGLGVTACNTGGGAADGTVTVNLTNADAANGHYLFVYVYAEGETDVNNPAAVLATNNVQIADGTASVVLKLDDESWMPTGTDWTGTGGVTYDIYIYTDSEMRTNIPGIFAAGDVIVKKQRQIITACGDAATAIKAIEHYNEWYYEDEQYL